MHKALAQAWRDLKHEGQKPYFDEYEKNKASYTAKVKELQEYTGGYTATAASAAEGSGAAPKRAASTASSTAAPVAYERGGSPAGNASTNDDDEPEDHPMGGTSDFGGFSAVNRA